MKKIFAICLIIFIFTTPVLANDYVQLRAFAEERGFAVSWDEEEQAVIMTWPGGNSVAFYLNSTHEVEIRNGRVYVPRVLAEGMTLPPRENSRINGMLTRVNYGENVAYLFGSMHASFPHWFPLAQIAEDAMRRADVFAFEADIFEEICDETLAQMAELVFLPNGQTLEDILPPDVFENFVKNLETYAHLGLTYEILENLVPIEIIIAIEHVMYMLTGLDMELSVDSYIGEFARANNLPVIGLNSVMGELSIIYSMPPEIQAYALVGFPDFETLLSGTRDTGLTEAYELHDIALLNEMFRTPDDVILCPFTELFNYNLMYVRDRIFADEIARLLRETEEPTTFFVTVGLAHLLESTGFVIPNLLEMGFEITSLWNEQ
jgi:uncharacterized protein YbaP (TraB family)